MADERPVDDPVEQLGKLQSDFEDFRSTMVARLARRPTGDIESTLRQTPKAGALLLTGQIVSRTTYAGLWQWAQDNSLVIAGLFTAGDGSTTFGLPNFAGRVLVGVGTLTGDTYAVGDLVGSAREVLVAANIPRVTTDGEGAHGGHSLGAYTFYRETGPYSLNVPNNWGVDESNHTHTLGNTSPTGVDIRQPSIAVNWMVWT